jgi:hypothetical protein
LLIVIEGVFNIAAVLVQFSLDLDTCSYLDMEEIDASFAVFLIDRFFTYVVPFVLISFVFWYSRKHDQSDFVVFLRESLDFTQYMNEESLNQEGINE